MAALFRDACTPYALRHTLNTDYDGAVKAIRRAGGDYRSVSSIVLHTILCRTRRVRRVVSFPIHRPLFTTWRKRVHGEWFVLTTAPGYNGHSIALKDGVARDNGWASFTGSVHPNLTVCAAWELS